MFSATGVPDSMWNDAAFIFSMIEFIRTKTHCGLHISPRASGYLIHVWDFTKTESLPKEIFSETLGEGIKQALGFMGYFPVIQGGQTGLSCSGAVMKWR